MRSKLVVVLFFGLAFFLAGCKTQDVLTTQEPGIPETGVVHDITDKNGVSLSVGPGDLLYIRLTGEAGSKRQWSVTSPISSAVIELKDHKITGLVDKKEAVNGMFIDDWTLKVLAPSEFDLSFVYGIPGKQPEKTYSIHIISN